MKTAIIFSGQGSQYIGMGKDLYDNFIVSKRVFEEASEGCQVDLRKLVFEGEKSELDLTENTQPAVVAMSMAAYAACIEEGLSADVVAGLSLGEYSALTASGVFSIEKVAGLVKKRGRFMQEAVPVGVGKMTAILNLSEELVKKACDEALRFGVVEAANYNCPGQIVIGGRIAAVDEAARIARELGAKRTLDLSVSAPFHTSLLEPASTRLWEELSHYTLGEMKIPVISNVNAEYIEDISQVKPLLCKQIMSSVMWEQSIRKMIADGVSCFVEVGPGKSLIGFVKKIDSSVAAFHVEDRKTLQDTISSIRMLA